YVGRLFTARSRTTDSLVHPEILVASNGKSQPSRPAETSRFLATPPEPGTSVSPSTFTDVQQLHVEMKNDREKSRRLVRTLRPRYGAGEGILREGSGGIAYAIEAVGRQPRKHVGLPDEP